MFTGSEISNWVLTVAGNIFIVVLVVYSIQHWAKKEWGQFIGFILGAIVIGLFVYYPQGTIGLIKGISSFIFKV